MIDYTLAVSFVLIATSVILIIILKRYKHLDFSIAISICISSLLLSLAFPFFAGCFGAIKQDGSSAGLSEVLTTFTFTIIAYIMIIFILSILVSSFINDSSVQKFIGKFDNQKLIKRITKSIPSRKGIVTQDQIVQYGELCHLIGIEEPLQAEELQEPLDAVEIQDLGANLEDTSEKFVDSAQFIDKMGIETSDSGKTLEQLIDRAFAFKADGRLEAAIQEYMKAFDFNPGKDLTFWLVLDICVLYKALNCRELAQDILQNYLTQYGNEMDETIKAQIEINLDELKKHDS